MIVNNLGECNEREVLFGIFHKLINIPRDISLLFLSPVGQHFRLQLTAALEVRFHLS